MFFELRLKDDTSFMEYSFGECSARACQWFARYGEFPSVWCVSLAGRVEERLQIEPSAVAYCGLKHGAMNIEDFKALRLLGVIK